MCPTYHLQCFFKSLKILPIRFSADTKLYHNQIIWKKELNTFTPVGPFTYDVGSIKNIS